MQIKLTFDSHKLKTWLNDLELRQIPFAEASALNGIAFRVQSAVRANLPKKFTIRNSWTAKGIQVERATKSNRVAIIGTIDKFLARHEDGGTFKPMGSKSFSIPLEDIRRNKKGIVTRSKWPGRLKGKNIRIAESKRGNGKIMLKYQRNAKPKLLWAFEKQIKIKPKLDFEKTANAIGEKFMATEFQEAFSKAIRTAR